jgi:hypothetical protein
MFPRICEQRVAPAENGIPCPFFSPKPGIIVEESLHLPHTLLFHYIKHHPPMTAGAKNKNRLDTHRY